MGAGRENARSPRDARRPAALPRRYRPGMTSAPRAAVVRPARPEDAPAIAAIAAATFPDASPVSLPFVVGGERVEDDWVRLLTVA